MKYIQRRR